MNLDLKRLKIFSLLFAILYFVNALFYLYLAISSRKNLLPELYPRDIDFQFKIGFATSFIFLIIWITLLLIERQNIKKNEKINKLCAIIIIKYRKGDYYELKQTLYSKTI
jgi:hypothetical protein